MAKNRGKKKKGKKNDGHTYSNKYKKKQDNQQPQASPATIREPPQPVNKIPAAAAGQDESNSHDAKTQQQQRAKYALQQVQAILCELENEPKEKKESNKKSFKSHASSMPAMILMNGLGQASAFYLSKGGVHQKLYTLLSNWLTRDDQPYAGQADLMSGITTFNMQYYRVAQAEALMLLDWVKKFASAYVREE